MVAILFCQNFHLCFTVTGLLKKKVTHVNSYIGLHEAVREKTHTQPVTHSPNHRTMVSTLDKASAPPMPPLPPLLLENNGGAIARGEMSRFTMAHDNYGGDKDEERPPPSRACPYIPIVAQQRDVVVDHCYSCG